MSDDGTSHEDFSEQEMAFLRHAEFGELPPRVRPEELVELTETETQQERPDPPWIWVPQG
ncbi:hypothetical protein [Krasilnikovia sp. MM14-A1004]|uniref:hypothetical protein n=1 Tax=Krasilnikovia sp. MM14-A1004 TaxID=3373541 RepID=UPI00399CDF6D